MKNNQKINSRLIHRLLLVLAVVLIAASLGGAYLITTSLNQNATKLLSLKAKIKALNTEQSELITAKKEITKYASLVKITKSIVPENKNQAQAVREIVNLAQANHITLSAIVFPSSTLGSLIPSSTTPGSGTAVAPLSKVSLSQLTAVKGIPGVYTLPIKVEDTKSANAVPYINFFHFLQALERNRLTSEVTGLNILPQNSPSNTITFSLTINEYIKPL